MTPGECIANYIQGKDLNRPHLFQSVFADDAQLVMVVKSGAISFPPLVHGLQDIADVLARRFGQTFENVYTFCLTAPPASDVADFSCPWMVGMSGKVDREVRVGCGRYDWIFTCGPSPRVARLTITIEEMVVLPQGELLPVMAWLSSLPSTWCDTTLAFSNAPRIQALDPIFNYCTQLTRSNA
jgi:hypothetical protein